MTSALLEAPDMAQAYAAAMRPVEDIRPSEFAEQYRWLKEGTTDKPGPWNNDVFPDLVDIMDCVQEAIETGKTGLVLMKSGQGGGSEAIINALAWLSHRYGGPMLYLISKDSMARRFGKERFEYLVRTCEPIKRKALLGRQNGEKMQFKPLTDGNFTIVGGRSVSNIESLPYRIVVIDEIDSLSKELDGQDLIEVAGIRTEAMTGKTLIIAFAHPTTEDKGAGRLYYEFSDQRRATIVCPHCGGNVPLVWENVRSLPHEGQRIDEAERDHTTYKLVAPCCGSVITDGERYAGIMERPKQISQLDPAIAEKKTWIGVHFSRLSKLNKSIASIAQAYIRGLDDPSIMRTFRNKTIGDVHEVEITRTEADDWRRLVILPRSEHDMEAYRLGTVPPGVRYLTAGQDSRATQLHWTVWGWGSVLGEAGEKRLCAWLIDCGIVEREKNLTLDIKDLNALDAFLYARSFPQPSTGENLWVLQGFHDSGWQPNPVYEYCSRHRGKAFPCKGDSLEDDRAVGHAPVRWNSLPPYQIGTRVVKDEAAKLAIVNTFTLKETWLGKVPRTFRDAKGNERLEIRLPVDVPEQFIAESASEYMAVSARNNRKIWKHKGPNHFSDCNIYAFASATNLRPAKDREINQGGQPKRRGYRRHGEGGSSSGWRVGR